IKPFRFCERSCAKQLSIRFFTSNVQRSTFNAQRPMTEENKTLTINEIYESIQGESTWAGERCVFVRLTFCDLRCNYCDTEYAFYEGKKTSLKEIAARGEGFRCQRVEITGG